MRMASFHVMQSIAARWHSKEQGERTASFAKRLLNANIHTL